MTVGRTGRINYIASLEPVNLLGTTVSKATLHNYDFIAKKDLRVGDIVQVYKAGEIIPEIANVLYKQRKEDLRKFVKGKTCPSCESILIQPENEVDQYCVNATCQAQQIKAISHFASRNAVDIRGLSEQIITKLWHAGFVKSFLDLYNLEQQRDALIALPNMGVRSVNNLLEAINASVHQSVAKLLYALGIKHVGLRTATLLIEYFQSLFQLADASVETLSHLKNIGSEIAASVADFFHQAQQNDLLGQLTKIGFNLTVQTQVGQLAQQKFVFTGSLQKPRSYYNKLLEAQGAVVQSQVTKTTNYVVIGAKPGSKALVAKQKKIALLTEEDLCHLLKVSYEKKD